MYRKQITQTEEERKERQKVRYDLYRELEKTLNDKLGIKKYTKPEVILKRDKKRIEKITEMWRLTGTFIEPTNKQILDEIIEEELIESDEVEYIQLEEIENKDLGNI